MSRRVADLIVYLLVIFPLNFVEFFVNFGYNEPLHYFAGYLFVPAMAAISLIILCGRLRLAILVQALYGMAVIVLKGAEDSEFYTGEDLFTAMFPMVLILVLIPVPFMYGYQKLVVERRST